ncbi:uncharacterized protein Dwil_GK27954, partial [Drosophila willistoni]
MAMKKLYSKTSFTSKKSNASVAVQSKPILAYHQAGAGAAASVVSPCEFQANALPPGVELIKRSQSMHHRVTPAAAAAAAIQNKQAATDYYSLEELQELDLLDYRHPMYHHYQQQQQELLLRQRSAYHEHEQLVLQLPMASRQSTSPTTQTMPIYEAPPLHSRHSSVNDQPPPLYVSSMSGSLNTRHVATSATPPTSSSSSSLSTPSSSIVTTVSYASSTNPTPTSTTTTTTSITSSALFSTLRKCVSPSPPATTNTAPPSDTLSHNPSRLACSMSFSIRTAPTKIHQQHQNHQQHQQHLYSN